MKKSQQPHFWIPDKEVEKIPKELTSRPNLRDVVYNEHGTKLSQGLQMVKQAIDKVQEDNSLRDIGLYVFKIEFPEGEKVQHKSELLSKNGMHLHAVKDERHAIVSTTRQQFQTLKNRIGSYTEKGTNSIHFDHIESVSPYIGSEKNSNELRKKVYIAKPPETVDIQLMFIPNLLPKEYKLAIKKVEEKIAVSQGIIQQEPYYLSDNTPIIRVIIPSNTLYRYENDSAIYRIEETRFFSADADNYLGTISSNMKIDPTINIDELPIVAVLDTGVNFVTPFDQLIVNHWKSTNSIGGNCEHGTSVASKVVFSDLGSQLAVSKTITPRARIIDCNILDGQVPENVMIKRIQEAVYTYSDIVKIFNLSANASVPIESDQMSIIGFELDALQLKYNVQFVISAGNHELWKTESSIEDILDDDDSKISPPADSMLGITVGAVVYEDHIGSLSGKNIIAPYSRCGPGFFGFSKPDICAYGGTIILNENGFNTPYDFGSLVMSKTGNFEPKAGTSFTAPAVAGDLAEISATIPGLDLLLAKALLYHNAKPLWESDDMDNEELSFAHSLYGRGISSVSNSKFSSPSRVTFVRSGILNKVTKERIRIYMPELLAAQPGRNIAKVTVTCISQPPVDRTKGSEYLGAYIRASLKKSHPDGHLIQVSQDYKEGRKEWDVCHHFSKMFSNFNSGDWQIWLELFSRWDKNHINVPYALVVTIEDVSETLDVYSEIQAQNRYQAINAIRLKIDT